MERQFKLIVNPVAGPGNNVKFLEKLRVSLGKQGLNPKVKFTKQKGHALRWAAKHVGKKPDAIIVSVGGDGTFNEVASALVGTKTIIAHIPRGSGNGLARMLKIPSKENDISRYLQTGVPEHIDVGSVNYSFFFSTFGFGFDALIAHHFDKNTKRGLKTYIRKVFGAFFSYKGIEATFSTGEKVFTGRFFSVTLANSNQFGNNAFIAPAANLQDGLLDLVIIKKFPWVFAPLMGLALFGKFIHLMPYVNTLKVQSVEVLTVSEPLFQYDGDVYISDLPLKISVLPGRLSILVPS